MHHEFFGSTTDLPDGSLQIIDRDGTKRVFRSKKAAKEWLEENRPYIIELGRCDTLSPNGFYNGLASKINYRSYPEE